MTPNKEKKAFFASLRKVSEEEPLRILMSACLAGTLCGYDGSANGVYPSALKLLEFKTARIHRFCPEEFSFGSPREMCDIHDGNGEDVLEGKARVLSDSGEDWSTGMIAGAEAMLQKAIEENIEIAVMMDISAACGSTVIYDGNRFSENKVYQIGAGVAASLLKRNGVFVISQRDFASLELLYKKLDPKHPLDQHAIDHDQTEWFKEYFNLNKGRSGA